MQIDRPAGRTLTARRPVAAAVPILVVLLLLLGALLYLQHGFRYFLHDDEGNYAYAAWRISQGEVPYRDFFTPQMPAFLYWGAAVVGILGPTFAALRLSSLAAILLAGCFLYALNREILGRPVALFSLGLFLIEPNVFHSARLFLPEAYMLAFQLAGLYAFVLGEKRHRPAYTALAGALLGLATLSKLFGALTLAGCFLYLLYASLRERRPLKQTVLAGLVLGLPALLLCGITAAVFGGITPYFVTAVFKHHTMQGAGMPLAARAAKAFELYRRYAEEQPPAMLLATLGAFLVLCRRKPLPSLLLWLVPTVGAFALLSRELLVRHMAYLAPALATLMAVSLVQLLSVQRILLSWRAPWRILASALVMAVALTVTLWGIRPWTAKTSADAALTEDGSQRLAALIRSLAEADEQVMSDYPGLNFLAGRRSTYWAAGMSGGAATSGQISGAKLIEDLEQNDVAVVIINISEHDAQITQMSDYPSFRRYVQQHYTLADRFEYAFFEYVPMTKALEVYARVDPFPLKPELRYQENLELQAVRLSESNLPAGSTLIVDARWRALQQMPVDYCASALLVDATGRQWAETHGRLQNTGGAPTSGWQPQEVTWARYALTLNPAMPAGDYYLVVQPYGAGSGFLQPSSPATGPTVQGSPIISTVGVLPPAEAPATPPEAAITYPLQGVSFGPHFDLLGYDLSTTKLSPGETVQVTLYWTYRQPSAIDYKVFVHLLDSAASVRGQHDAVPAGGGALTTGWVQEDILIDRFDVPLEPAAPSGTLQIEVGFYDLATGERLPLLCDGEPTGEDRLILPTEITAR